MFYQGPDIELHHSQPLCACWSPRWVFPKLILSPTKKHEHLAQVILGRAKDIPWSRELCLRFLSGGVTFIVHGHVIKCSIYWQELRSHRGPFEHPNQNFFNLFRLPAASASLRYFSLPSVCL